MLGSDGLLAFPRKRTWNEMDVMEKDCPPLHQHERRHLELMTLAMEMAQEALDAGEVPVGCVFVLKDSQTVLMRTRNETNARLNATMHAEIVAINAFSPELRAQIPDMELFVTVEPCIMCAAALRQVGIRHVYYGAANEKFGGCGSVLNLHCDPNCSPFPPYSITTGILKEEAIMMLRRFYIRENDHAPVPRKKTNRVLKPVI